MGSAICGASSKQKSQVQEQLELLAKSRDRLTSTINELEERLISVLDNVSEDKAMSETPQQPLTPLADMIRNQEEGFCYLDKKVRGIIERLQL